MIGALATLGMIYAVAAIPFGLLVSTVWGRGEDVREAGSGNIGTTNVFRTQGPTVAGVVLALDAGKGLGAVLLARAVWPDGGLAWDTTAALVAFGAHCLPVYLAFRGGKGVATGAGAMAAIAPLSAGIAVAVWAVILAVTGRSSVASLLAAASLVGAVAFIQPETAPAAIALAAGVALTHTGNLRRIVDGSEAAVITPLRRARTPASPDPEALLAQGPAGETGPAPGPWR